MAWAVVQATLPCCPPVVAAMVEVQWWSGMRSGDINQEGPVVDGVRTWIYVPGSDRGPGGRHKNSWRETTPGKGQARTILLGPECQRLLTPFLKPHDSTAFLFSPRESVERRNAVRRQRPEAQLRRQRRKKPHRAPGECYSDLSYARALMRACDRAGVKRWHPYQTRHAAKVRAENTPGVGLEGARMLLGHRHLSTTASYGRENIAGAAQVAARLG